jgi:hypothetical protein
MQMDQVVYTATAERSGKWWALSVDGVPGAHTQVRRLNQAEAMVREVIALLLDVPQDSFSVRLSPVLAGPLQSELNRLTRARGEQIKANAAVEAHQRNLVEALVVRGDLTVRDAAIVLGTSFQRVSQIVADAAAIEEEPGRFSLKAYLESTERVHAIYAKPDRDHPRLAIVGVTTDPDGEPWEHSGTATMTTAREYARRFGLDQEVRTIDRGVIRWVRSRPAPGHEAGIAAAENGRGRLG